MTQINDVNMECIQEFMDMLTGKSLPEGMIMAKQPSLDQKTAFSILWYLQVHLRVVPDRFERCRQCDDVFDSHVEGYTTDPNSDDEFYEEWEVPQNILRRFEGAQFCSTECEYDFLMGVKVVSDGA